MTAGGARTMIISYRMAIDCLQAAINEIAEMHIPDFHFLSHRVSTFWECDKSPIGMCVFTLDDMMVEVACRYCGGPKERK